MALTDAKKSEPGSQQASGVVAAHLRPMTVLSGPGRPFYNLVQLVKHLNVWLSFEFKRGNISYHLSPDLHLLPVPA